MIAVASGRTSASRRHKAGAAVVASLLTLSVAIAPFAIRDAVRAASLRFTTFALPSVAAPLVFLCVVLLIARLATHGPLVLLDDRPMVGRWLRDGALFALAMAALLLCSIALHRHDAQSMVDTISWQMRDVVVPALTEEIAFRGFLAVAIATVLAPIIDAQPARLTVAFALSAVAFALAHQSVSAEPDTVLAARFAAGLVFGLLTLHSRSLVPAMFAHAAVNAGLSRC